MSEDLNKYEVCQGNMNYIGDINFMIDQMNTQDNVLLNAALFNTIIEAGNMHDIEKLLFVKRFGKSKRTNTDVLFDVFMTISDLSTNDQMDILIKFADIEYDSPKFNDVCDKFVRKYSCNVRALRLAPNKIDSDYTDLLDALSEFYSSGQHRTGLVFQKLYDDTVNKYSQLISREEYNG